MLGAKLPFDSLNELHQQLHEAVPHLRRSDQIIAADASKLRELADADGKWASDPFATAVSDFYLTNPIARASRIMAEMSQLRAKLHSLVAAE